MVVWASPEQEEVPGLSRSFERIGKRFRGSVRPDICTR